MGYQLTEDYVLEKNSILIQKWCTTCGKGLEREDRFQIGCKAFLRAMRTWRKGYSDFHTYAEKEVHNALQKERTQRNRVLRVNSSFSLDQPIKNNEGNQRSCIFCGQTGDFVDTLIFADFLATLPHALHKIANAYLQGYYPQEIMEMHRLSKEKLEECFQLIGIYWEKYST